jgi:hypothetical protein
MPTSEFTEIQDLIERAFVEEFGSRASADEVLRSIVAILPEHLDHHLKVSGIKSAIGTFFRRKRSDGLPQAPEATADGVHVQLDFMDVPEFQYVIGQYVKSSEASYSQAEKLAALCREVHGVSIVLTVVEESA